MALDFSEVLTERLPPVSRTRLADGRARRAGPMPWLDPEVRRQIEAVDWRVLMWEVGDGSTVTVAQQREAARWLVRWMMHHPGAKQVRDIFMHAFSSHTLDGSNVVDLMIDMCVQGVKTGTITEPR